MAIVGSSLAMTIVGEGGGQGIWSSRFSTPVSSRRSLPVASAEHSAIVTHSDMERVHCYVSTGLCSWIPLEPTSKFRFSRTDRPLHIPVP